MTSKFLGIVLFGWYAAAQGMDESSLEAIKKVWLSCPAKVTQVALPLFSFHESYNPGKDAVCTRCLHTDSHFNTQKGCFCIKRQIDSSVYVAERNNRNFRNFSFDEEYVQGLYDCITKDGTFVGNDIVFQDTFFRYDETFLEPILAHCSKYAREFKNAHDIIVSPDYVYIACVLIGKESDSVVICTPDTK